MFGVGIMLPVFGERRLRPAVLVKRDKAVGDEREQVILRDLIFEAGLELRRIKRCDAAFEFDCECSAIARAPRGSRGERTENERKNEATWYQSRGEDTPHRVQI